MNTVYLSLLAWILEIAVEARQTAHNLRRDPGGRLHVFAPRLCLLFPIGVFLFLALNRRFLALSLLFLLARLPVLRDAGAC